jgi:hypothetical protein
LHICVNGHPLSYSLVGFDGSELCPTCHCLSSNDRTTYHSPSVPRNFEGEGLLLLHGDNEQIQGWIFVKGFK